MNILPGKRADNLEEATPLAFREAERGDISPDIATAFASAIDADKLRAEAERSINTTVRDRYGRSAIWYGKPWFIPLPQPRHDALPIPRVTFAVQGHLVAPIAVKIADDSYRATLVGPTGKPEKLLMVSK